MFSVLFKKKPGNALERGGRTPSPGDTLPCPNCHRDIPGDQVNGMGVCGACGYHLRIPARRHLMLLADEGSAKELFYALESRDPISFPGYQQKLSAARAASCEREAVVSMECRVSGMPLCAFAMDHRFMMGSMGAAVGEKITRTFEYATERRLPVIGFALSGGARMQEGLLSLMQMAKTSFLVRRHSDAGLLYVSVLTDPTTGGVTASFAMEGDITLAEPGATIGFAGRRVIEQASREKLPKDFQTAETLLEHGFVDAIVPRPLQREVIGQILSLHGGEKA